MKKFTLLLTFFAIGLQILIAQTREISGTIISAESGESIPGAIVTIKGTSQGTISDMDGAYRIKVLQGATTIVFSFVGMRSQEVPIRNQTTINVKMSSEFIAVDEVVVTALGMANVVL